VRAKFPNLTAGQVANRLVKTAYMPDKSLSLPDPHYGYGIIDPYKALTQDIDPGSAQGPLATPTALADSSSSAAAPGDGQGTSTPSGGKFPLAAVALGGGLLLVVIIVVIVVATRSRRRPPSGPVPLYGAAPGWPPAQQPYGNQPPPPGYPAQQPPYQNPYQQGGNQSS
jgi:hypothetical protein